MVRCRKLSSLFVIIGASIVLASYGANAGGILLPDLGTVALGRSGAFVARADNLSAFYYNPAGLSKSKGFNLLLSSNLIDVNVDFLRQGGNPDIEPGKPGAEMFPRDPRYPGVYVINPGKDYARQIEDDEGQFWPQNYRKVSQQTPIFPSGVAVVGNWGDAFNVEGLSIALGLTAPSADPSPSYPNGPQRYNLVKMEALIVSPGLGISYAINRYFQIGAVFNAGVAMIEMQQKGRVLNKQNSFDLNENLTGDASFTINAKDWFMPTGVIGILSNPVDWLEIGVSARAPMYVSAKGTVDFEAPQTDVADAVIVEGHDKATVNLHFPVVVSGGVRYIHRIFDIEADFVWENWSTFDGIDAMLDLKIDIDNDGINIADVPDVSIPKNYRSTYSARIGSDVEVWPENITARVGGFYQSSAYPKNNNTFSLVFPFGQQFGVGGGITWKTFEFLHLNVGYLHIFQPRVTVKTGILQQIVGQPIDVSPEQDGSDLIQNGNVVNNGIYDVNVNLFAASVEGHF